MMRIRDGICMVCGFAACACLIMAEFHEATQPHAHYRRPAFTLTVPPPRPEHTHLEEFDRSVRIESNVAAIGGGVVTPTRGRISFAEFEVPSI